MYLKNDVSGVIGEFANAQTGWSTPTQGELSAYFLENAKSNKIIQLNSAKLVFCDAGFLYSGNTFSLSDNSTANIILKNGLPSGAPDRYKYYDIIDIQHDFIDANGWNAFFNAIIPEKDRIMRYYCSKKKEINEATTVAQVEAITINFSA